MSDYTGQPIGGLPIMDQAARLVGIITESDIFRLVARKWNRDRGTGY